jgi:hypothetical protein
MTPGEEPRGSGRGCPHMQDYPIDPPLVVKDTPKPRSIHSLNEARVFVDEMLRLRRFVKWREMLNRLDGVKSEDEAVEAIGALRELLELEDLLQPPPIPTVL